MYSGSQLQQPADVNPLGMPRNKGLATRANGANGAAAGPRRALGDITNASHNAPVDLHKAGDVPHKAFGLASAAPMQHASTHHSMPLASDVDDVMMEPSSEEKRMATDEGGPHSAVVEEMMMSLDLATEVGEMEDLMNVEDEGTAGVVREGVIGAITDDLQGMTIQLGQGLVGPVDDIDAADGDNPLAVTEYVNDQYSFYRMKECRPGYDPNYMAKQPFINTRMRTILVDWLVEVHCRLKGEPETLYLTVNILDRFLDRKQVPKNKLQLVGITAYLIASKYEEIYPPEVKELSYMTDNAYDKKQILDMESRMLATLKFNITVCTAYCFLVRFCKAAHADNRVFFLASYICERTLQEMDSLHFLPSMVAAASVYLARKNSALRPWSPTLVHYTHYTEETLLPCLRVMSPWITSSRSQQVAVKTKYSSSKFSRVAMAELMGIA